MAAEREIKTVLTLDDASFSKGLKAASSDVKAAQAEMQRAVTASGRLGQGFRQATAKVTGLGKVLKAQKTQLSVLNQEYGKQRQRLLELQKALEKAKKEHGEDSEEVKKAADAYAAQSAAVNDLREKMAKLQTQMNQNKRGLTDTLLQPFEKAKTLITSTAKVAVAAFAAGGIALAKFTVDADKAKNEFTYALNGTKATFKEWNVFLQQEAKDAWKTLGLSQAEYLSVANQIGQQLEKAGVPVQTAAGWVAEAFDLAGQLSERFGVPVEQVMADIAAAATGENKNALDQYGISITGINDSMTDSQQASEVLEQAMAQTSRSAGQFETNVDSVDRKMKELQAAWTNFKAGVGSEEDVAQAAAGAATAFGKEFTQNLGTVIKVAPAFFNSFVKSFKEGWSSNVWPAIQDLFKTQFNVELPDWSDIMQGLINTWVTVRDRISEFFQKPFEVLLPDSANEIIKKINDFWENDIAANVNLALGFELIPVASKETKAVIEAMNASPVTDVWDAMKPGALNQDMKNTLKNVLGFAGGLYNVPADDYMARLHSGEMVLTADQAARYRALSASGGNTYNDSASIYVDKYYQYTDEDPRGLLDRLQALQRRQRLGYGH